MAPISTDRLKAGQSIHIDESLWSKNERFNVTLQRDGNLIVYDNKDHGTRTLWTSERAGQSKPWSFVVQEDGNMVTYAAGGTPYWASQTYGKAKNATLIMQDDGNLVGYEDGGKAFWHTNTAQQ